MSTPSNSPIHAHGPYSDNPSSGMRTHGGGNASSIPQSPSAEEDRHQLEYSGLMVRSPPRKNCCTWKVAAVFLFFVAGALVVTWLMLPAEEIVAKYIPRFEEPAVRYSGPEAGAPSPPSSSGGNSEDDGNGGGGIGIDIDIPPEEESLTMVGTTVPSFMRCPEEGGSCCNGSPANCILRLDQMMFGLVHNSMSAEEGDFPFGYNHKLGLEKALIAGYRGLSLDVCNCYGVLQFCHNVCNLGERLPNDVFSSMTRFLKDYPSEVVVLVFEASKEQGPIVWDDLYSEMNDVDGFTDMIYVHTYGDAWPTMGHLVENNKRVIVFYFNGGTCNDGSCPPGFHYFYNYAAETQYQSASLADLEDDEYSCEVTRGPKEDAPQPASFFVVNNFVTPPDEDAARTTNSKTFLADRLTRCANANRMRPNFVYLDFWSEGVTAQLVQYANQQFAEQLGR
mmetsp:Transcript_17617/g.38167  ORF Transcript_17617/g.38167 Transcript_17617/m.38167 type:complete len:449 (-) Transcript_17617:70-1416(-)|eukprot:CAMPEP_0172545536 /NCGR_PEP_ID=MMETSP1067-20121228/15439_1 /TAXON_ID=265564 ORGANISM="Thalassiosira punctigera, Strain Tpunct2005C2" /NCGR_SAMPLE_ID=MMETSP1067 /ASSEMBLY_ACC=CAM_ASM_000444 /LENGTH=448 /DNA_ID=CAMNT_0013332297 /DNA_START=87 /DNA_END=1433 /DNA_ORIENTATION=-